DHDRVDTIFALTLDKNAMEIEPIETMRGNTLTTDARVTASSSANPRSKRGAPETVVYYSFETGKFTRHFGEESDDKGVRIDKSKKRHYSIEEIEQLRKLIGTNHRGHFWRYWMPRKGDERPWIEVDLGNPETFSKVGITELFGKVRAYELQYRDASQWKTFYRDAGTIDNLTVHLAKPVTAQRVRLLITETSGQLPTVVAFDLFE
ncbi:MAG: discoidin domain-containing protein, partial [Pirellulaceae bacterium]|nr:discoidin domain-containing protein [Pirellulaceae bacterium]